MSKVIKIYIGVLVVFIVLASIAEINKPRQIDWTPTFHEQEKIPFGLKVFRDELKDLTKADSVNNLHITLYEYIEQIRVDSTENLPLNGSYLYIDQLSYIDEVSAGRLLEYVEAGNTAFISSQNFPWPLEDSLNFDTNREFELEYKGNLFLSNSIFKGDSLHIDIGSADVYFDELDSLNSQVLGYQNFKKERINFVKINYGKGQFLLHTQPYVFTNYYLLEDDNHKYVADLISYIPQKHIIYDAKAQIALEETTSPSPLRFIFSQPSLKWAWFLFLILVLTFMLFNAKRRQRIIKVIKPMENSSIQFTKTVANLYYESKDHSNIITKKITFFLEKIRTQYQLNTAKVDQNFKLQLASKSGNNLEFIEKLMDFIVYLKSKNKHTQQELIQLNRMIEKFQNKK